MGAMLFKAGLHEAPHSELVGADYMPGGVVPQKFDRLDLTWEMALSLSSKGSKTQARDMLLSSDLQTKTRSLSPQRALTAFIDDVAFPCVGAKAARNKGRMRFAEYSSLGCPSEASSLCSDLRDFSDEFPDPGVSPVSFVAMFRDQILEERSFESALWRQLQLMHEHDRHDFKWDTSVNSDPASHDFSFSIGGRAFFVVGLHRAASRASRRAPFPCLVFNFHDQFEALKSSGKYQSMQTAIRARDIKLQGSVNPVLEHFGAASEARQYSGRAVEGDWRCPFSAKEANNA